MGWVQLVFIFLGSLVRCQAELSVENLALRQQFAILKEKTKRPSLRPRDRMFWVLSIPKMPSIVVCALAGQASLRSSGVCLVSSSL